MEGLHPPQCGGALLALSQKPGNKKQSRSAKTEARISPILCLGASSYKGNPGAVPGYQTRLTYIKLILTTIYVPDMVFALAKRDPAALVLSGKVHPGYQRLNWMLNQPVMVTVISRSIWGAGEVCSGFVIAALACG
ncbi:MULTISPECIES: hypothetical protein [Burkholderia]|uniref:hypothetical protein n=1 Tax=Burkholderia TaxID=32008 RepID=UPI001F07078F|nr:MULTISPECIES: hypothetical protein [Burkholderia]